MVLDKKRLHQQDGTILKDKTKFQLRKSDGNLENLKKFQGFLSRLKKEGVLGESVFIEFRPTATVTPTLHGLTKVKKDKFQ